MSIEKIELQVVSPSSDLPGLDLALKRLAAIDAAINRVNANLAGMSSGDMFSRTKKQLEGALSSITTKKIPVQDALAAWGFPNEKDFMAHLGKLKAAAKGFKLTSVENGTEMFRSIDQAARAAQSYSAKVRKNMEKQGVGGIQNYFGTGSGTVPSASAGAVNLSVPAAQIVATLGPGLIPLVVPPSQVGASPPGGSGGGGSRGAGGGGGGGGSLPGGTGALLSEREITGAGRAKLVNRKELISAGKTVETFFKEVEDGFEEIKQVGTKSPVAQVRAKLQDKLANINNELQGLMAENGRDPRKLAAIIRKQADIIESAFGGKTGDQLQSLGLNQMANRAGGQVARMRRRATELDARGNDAATRQAVTDLNATGRLRATLERARAQGQQVKEQEAAEELRQMEREIRDRNRMLASRAKSDAKASQAADAARRLASAQQQGTMSHGEAQRVLNEAVAAGYTLGPAQRSTRVGGSGRSSVSYDATQDKNGQKLTTRVRFDFENGRAVGAQVQELARTLKETRGEAGALGGDFLKNTMKVTAWAASVGVLYKSIELARHSMHSLVEVGGQTARLDQVFRQMGGSTRELVNDTLALGAANGRTSEEAMESAIRWSRLGLTRAQVNEAVRVSLVAANVAQISANEATEHMSAIMASYNLRASDLRTVLAEMNSITNTYNVTNADMLEGIARTAAIAKQAKLPLAELMGLLGAGIGGTGQTGANIGNALKSVMLALSNPALQKDLRQQFRLEVTTAGGGDIKNMGAVLSDLYVKFQELNDLQRQSMLFSIAGKTQASRLSAVLEGYVRAQVLAINAQLNMNNADEENAKIKATLKSQLTGLITEWERFVVVQGNRGPVQALAAITQALHNVFKIMNTDKGGIAMTGMLGVVTAISAKLAVTSLTMKNTAGATGFLANSIKSIKGALETLGVAWLSSERGMLRSKQSWVTMDPLFRSTGTALMGVALQMQASSNVIVRGLGNIVRGLNFAMLALRQFIVIGAAVYGATWAFDKVMEGIGLSSERAESRLAGFNAEAEKSKSAAAAFVEAANLMQTVQRALPKMRDEERSKALSQIAEVTEENPAKRKSAEMEHLRLLGQEGGQATIINMLEQKRVEFINKAALARQREFEANKKFMKDNAAEIQRLKNTRSGPGEVFGGDSREKKISELEGQQSERQHKQIQLTLDETNDLESKLASDQRHQTALEKQKLALESIAELYRGLPTGNRAETLGNELAMLEAQNEALTQQHDIITNDNTALREGDASRSLQAKSIREQIELLREQVPAARAAAEATPGYGKLFLTSTDNTGIRQKEATIAKYQQIQDEIASKEQELAMAQAPGNSAAEMSLLQQRIQNEKQQRENQQRIDALRAEVQSPRMLTSMMIGQGQEESRMTGLRNSFGLNDAEKMRREMEALGRRNREISGQPATPLNISETIANENRMKQLGLDIRRRSAEVEKEINQTLIERNREFQKSLLSAGSQDLVRKMVAWNMSQKPGGISAGQFMAASPNMRADLAILNPRFDPHFMDLQRERNQLNRDPNVKMSGTDFAKDQLEWSKSINEFTSFLKTTFSTLPTGIADNLAAMREAAQAGTIALNGLTAAAIQFTNFVRGNITGGTLNLLLPQAMGVQGGTTVGLTGR